MKKILILVFSIFIVDHVIAGNAGSQVQQPSIWLNFFQNFCVICLLIVIKLGGSVHLLKISVFSKISVKN